MLPHKSFRSGRLGSIFKEIPRDPGEGLKERF